MAAGACTRGTTDPDEATSPRPDRISISLMPATESYYDVGAKVQVTARAYDATGHEMPWTAPRRWYVLDTNVVQVNADDTFTARRVGSSWLWVIWRAPSDITDSVAVRVGVRGVGTVRYIGVEGGCWLIQTDAVTTYEPVNLPSNFKIDGLRVRFAAGPSAYGSFCMVGRLVELDSIRVENP